MIDAEHPLRRTWTGLKPGRGRRGRGKKVVLKDSNFDQTGIWWTTSKPGRRDIGLGWTYKTATRKKNPPWK